MRDITKIVQVWGLYLRNIAFYINIARWFLIFNKTGSGSNLFKYSDPVYSRYQNQVFAGKVDWFEFKMPVNAFILQPDKNKKALPGTIGSLSERYGLLSVNVDGKCGLYRIMKDSFLIPAVYDSIIYIKPDMLLAINKDTALLYDIAGNTYPWKPDPKAIYIEKTTGNYVLRTPLTPGAQTFTLMSNEGKLLLSPDRAWEYQPDNLGPKCIRLRKTKENLKYGESVFQLADLNGHIVIPNVQEITKIDEDHLKITDLGPGERKEYLYDTKLNSVSTLTTRSQGIPNSIGLNVVTKDGQRLYYNMDGKLLATIDDSALNGHKEELFVRKLQITLTDSACRATGIYRRIYYAVRSHTNERFAVYDDHFKKLNELYDSFQYLDPAKQVSYKRNGKWGMLDCEFKEIAPPIFDRPLNNWQTCAIGEVNGIKKRLDLQTFRIIDMTLFDEFDLSHYGGKYLAVSYFFLRKKNYFQSNDRVITLFITDSSGKVLDSSVRNDYYSYKYAFTSNGKIIKYPDNDQSVTDCYLTDGIRGKEKVCPYTFGRMEMCRGVALLIECRNEKGELGIISANDFSIVVPFGKYDYLFTYPKTISSAGDDDQVMEALEIKGGTNEMHEASVNSETRMMSALTGQDVPSDREVIGYYSLSGKKYWDK